MSSVVGFERFRAAELEASIFLNPDWRVLDRHETFLRFIPLTQATLDAVSKPLFVLRREPNL
jgi:hypothetical protein